MAAFFKVWLGRTEFGDAVQDGSIELLADPTLESAFPTWFAWSAAASVVRAVV